MPKFKPIHGILLILLISGGLLGLQMLLEGRLSSAGYERVAPAADGAVHLSLAGLGANQVRFYRFLNRGNQEVLFFVGRDESGVVQVAFDANEICYKSLRGYRHEGAWVTCNKCDKSFQLAEVNAGGGGCKPIPVVHRVSGDELVIAEHDMLAGWRYFN